MFYQFLFDKTKVKDRAALKSALEKANEENIYLYQYLINQNIYKDTEMYTLLGMYFNIPFSEINSLSVDEEIVRQAPLYFLKSLNIIPVKIKGNKLIVALSEPHHLHKVRDLKIYYNQELEPTLVTPQNLMVLFEYVENKQRKKDVIGEIETKDTPDIVEIDEEMLADSPAVKLADSLLKEAITTNASDIHIEPFEHFVKVRFRIDGHLIENTRLPKTTYQQLLARFKIIADLNIAERRIPQDGKITLTFNERDYDFRISTIPTIHGEKIVIRVYNLDSSDLTIEELGFFEDQYRDVRRIIEKPYGIVLVTGPTGSGKTTTLYSFLKELNKDNVNITTVEDPVENQILGINQIQINPKANLTFYSALRAILRQDPNIIMIGEIRDEETAQMAIRAAITGHLVFSTLHTNDAVSTITRLVDMGVPRYLLADAISGSLAQRLCRKLCPSCKRRVKPTLSEQEILGIDENTKIYRAKGCSECNYTGYRGRRAVFEVINFTTPLKKMIADPTVTTDDIRAKLKEMKVKFLRDSCLKLVLDGVTSVEEFDTIVNFE